MQVKIAKKENIVLKRTLFSLPCLAIGKHHILSLAFGLVKGRPKLQKLLAKILPILLTGDQEFSDLSAREREKWSAAFCENNGEHCKEESSCEITSPLFFFLLSVDTISLPLAF